MTRLGRHFMIVGGLMAAVVIAVVVAAPRTAKGALFGDDTPKPGRLAFADCFHEHEVRNWVAPDAKTLYLRVFTNRYYRVDLASECSPLRERHPVLITHSDGSDLICAPIDWNLRATDWPGDVPETCFIKGITRLSPDEAAALPKNAKP